MGVYGRATRGDVAQRPKKSSARGARGARGSEVD